MDYLLSIWQFIQANGMDLLGAYLMVLGGLKVIARYTKWKGDDLAIEVLEKPALFLRDKLLFFKKGDK